MNEQTGQTPSQPGAAPARVELEDFIEAVTRGVARALAAQDEVSGYSLRAQGGNPATPKIGGVPILIGIVYNPPDRFGGALGDLSQSVSTKGIG